MTLFRKVFQNQARLASREEALSEQALRETFAEQRENRAADPFEADLAVPSEDAFERALDDLLRDADDEVSQPLRLSNPVDQGAHADTPETSARDGSARKEAETRTDAHLQEGEAELLCPDEAAQKTVAAGHPRAHDADADADADVDADTGAVLDRVDTVTAPEATAVADSQAPEPITDILPQAPADPPSADTAAHDIVAFAQAQVKAMDQTDPAGSVPAPEPENQPLNLAKGPQGAAVPAPAAGRAGRRAGRVKTRLLGFNRPEAAQSLDPVGGARTTAAQPCEKFPVGWLAIVEGPGVGHSFSLFSGASVIGRGDDQVIKLDFGDTSISRENHAAIAYDDEQNKFYIGHGGKSNIIRRNGRPVLSTEELHHADLIRIGETTLRFVALCGSDFQWEAPEADDENGL